MEASKETDATMAVDRLLREAGWNPEDTSWVLTSEATSEGQAGYVLLDNRGRPLAVVQAKRFSIDPHSARQQAHDYAGALNVPCIVLSNGESTPGWPGPARLG